MQPSAVHAWFKKVSAKNLKKATLKKMLNQNGQSRPPAADGIKIFDNDDQATKHYCCLLACNSNVLRPGHHYQKL